MEREAWFLLSPGSALHRLPHPPVDHLALAKEASGRPGMVSALCAIDIDAVEQTYLDRLATEDDPTTNRSTRALSESIAGEAALRLQSANAGRCCVERPERAGWAPRHQGHTLDRIRAVGEDGSSLVFRPCARTLEHNIDSHAPLIA